MSGFAPLSGVEPRSAEELRLRDDVELDSFQLRSRFMRRLSVSPAKIASAELLPWELDPDAYGISYRKKDGREGAEVIGTKAEAESVLQDLGRQQEAPGAADILPFPKDVAAS
jgi:hypothetical protein